jgi:hypothetical protein
MLAEPTTLTVREARRLLQDTSRVPTEAIESAQRVLQEFREKRPHHKFCLACGCGIWGEHYAKGGDLIWACNNCHRSADFSREQLFAEQAPTRATDAKRTVAIRQLAEAELEPSVTAALEARIAYVNAIAALGWLIRQGHGDARAARLLQEADTPPSRWPEAAPAAASGGRLAARLAELEGEQ